MTDAAILLYLDGAPRAKQEAACIEYCAGRGYQASTLVFHAHDALALVACGAVQVIVAAYQPADEADLSAEVAAAGGRLERAREDRISRKVAAIIGRLFDRGMTVAEISEVMEQTTGEIRRSLARRILRPDRERRPRRLDE